MILCKYAGVNDIAKSLKMNINNNNNNNNNNDDDNNSNG